MSGPHATTLTTRSASKVTEQPRPALRLRLKPKAPTTGYVDGAWWPRPRDLSAELPALLAVLAVRPDRIERVTYNLTAWQSAGRRLRTEGGIVRLEGFHMQRPGTVAITGQSRERLTLLVMPPQSRPGLGAPSDDGGIAPGNVESIGELLPPDRPATPSVTDAADVETRRWELDGGRI